MKICDLEFHAQAIRDHAQKSTDESVQRAIMMLLLQYVIEDGGGRAISLLDEARALSMR